MLERDYLMRLISQAASVLGRSMGLREHMKQQEALEMIDEFLSKELRLRSRLAMGLTDEQLLQMLTVGGVPNAESVAVIAACLQEEAILLADLGQADQAIPRYAKALRLNLYLLRENVEIEGWNLGARAEELLEALSPYRLDVETKRAIWSWHESNASFADAEDLLYELFEETGVTAREGEEFYARLSAIPDDGLIAGGMPRNELEEGRRQWQALVKENIG
ncbi:DUF6483 family protein [Cohnella yongneupensis]|uniref:DUF6483 family protein n=1 Tax=Cohnella yongneupensis TaxID=425006 RepID=A0ABW0R4W4_9BACL